MAERRMFSKSIVESDAFLDMSFSAQVLYLHMSMNADDEGFVNSTRRICGMCGVDEKELENLVEKGFLIRFSSGICVIKHWKINNRIRGDRVKNTNYPEEKVQLIEKSNGVYSMAAAGTIGNAETFSENRGRLPPEPDDGTDCEPMPVVKDSLTTENEGQEETEYELQTEAHKSYAEQVFDVLFSHKLPCCKGNLITFTMRDFKLASSELSKLHLHSDDVIAAVENYAKVIDLKRQDLTWWNSEQDFFHFCQKKTILKFLPENFKLEDYLKQKSEASPIEDKIQL